MQVYLFTGGVDGVKVWRSNVSGIYEAMASNVPKAPKTGTDD